MNYTILDDIESRKILNRFDGQLNNAREEYIKKKLEELNKLGFYVELLPQIEPKFFVEKQGFSIKESLILTKEIQQDRPNVEEIFSKLKYDDQTNILKLEYQNMIFSKEDYINYILILGPPNRGKTTFIFNIINSIYNVQYNSFYRVQKNSKQSQGQYYDEYCIKIQNKNYVFVDFKGFGDVKLDFLGLDSTGNSNLYVEILKYFGNKLIQNATLTAIFYVNSSSINRLSEDETYCLQRFFELIPQGIINDNKLFLVLTYCTDGQPNTTIYKQSLSTPQQLRTLLENQIIDSDKKFWYGLNNKPLYDPIIYYENCNSNQEVSDPNWKIQKLIIDFENPLINSKGQVMDFLEPQENNNDGRQLGVDDSCKDDERKTVEIEEKQLGKFQYNLMANVIKNIISKIQTLSNMQDQSEIQNQFQQQLQFELDILELLKIYKLSSYGDNLKEGFNMQDYTTTYLIYKYEDLNEKETIKIKKGTRLLMCNNCHVYCHINCYLQTTNRQIQSDRRCRKFIFDNGKNYCKICNKKDNTKFCEIDQHILLNETQDIPKQTLICKINLNNYSQIKDRRPINKKSKSLYRLKQTAALKAKRKYEDQIENINKNNQKFSNIDLNKRAKYLNAMMNQLENNNQNVEFYNKLVEIRNLYKRFLNDDQSEEKQQLQQQQLQQQQLQQQQLQQQQLQQQQQQQQVQRQSQIQSSVSFANQSMNNGSFGQYQNSQQSVGNQSGIQNQQYLIDQVPSRHNQLQNSGLFQNNNNEQQRLITD